MSRTRKTPLGMKTRFIKRRTSKHGPIRRLIGDEPMMTLAEAIADANHRDVLRWMQETDAIAKVTS